jgi:hypothetical protein
MKSFTHKEMQIHNVCFQYKDRKQLGEKTIVENQSFAAQTCLHIPFNAICLKYFLHHFNSCSLVTNKEAEQNMFISEVARILQMQINRIGHEKLQERGVIRR